MRMDLDDGMAESDRFSIVISANFICRGVSCVFCDLIRLLVYLQWKLVKGTAEVSHFILHFVTACPTRTKTEPLKKYSNSIKWVLALTVWSYDVACTVDFQTEKAHCVATSRGLDDTPHQYGNCRVVVQLHDPLTLDYIDNSPKAFYWPLLSIWTRIRLHYTRVCQVPWQCYENWAVILISALVKESIVLLVLPCMPIILRILPGYIEQMEMKWIQRGPHLLCSMLPVIPVINYIFVQILFVFGFTNMLHDTVYYTLLCYCCCLQLLEPLILARSSFL